MYRPRLQPHTPGSARDSRARAATLACQAVAATASTHSAAGSECAQLAAGCWRTTATVRDHQQRDATTATPRPKTQARRAASQRRCHAISPSVLPHSAGAFGSPLCPLVILTSLPSSSHHFLRHKPRRKGRGGGCVHSTGSASRVPLSSRGPSTAARLLCLPPLLLLCLLRWLVTLPPDRYESVTATAVGLHVWPSASIHCDCLCVPVALRSSSQSASSPQPFCDVISSAVVLQCMHPLADVAVARSSGGGTVGRTGGGGAALRSAPPLCAHVPCRAS